MDGDNVTRAPDGGEVIGVTSLQDTELHDLRL